MGKFYLPSGTNGVYDPKASTLTANLGDRVRIGFRPTGQAELDAAAVSLSEASKILATYDGGGLNREYEIDTSGPGRYTLTAQNRDTFRDVATPLTVRVRVRNFATVSPQGQWKDPTACWMASLGWWQGSLAVFGDRAPTLVSYNTILMQCGRGSFKNGTVSGPAFRSAVQRNNGALHMRTEMIGPGALRSVLGRWPLVIAFRTPDGTGHMNVLYSYDEDSGMVGAMEPWAPDTDTEGWDQGTPYIVDPDFAFTGAHVTRPMSYYTKPAPGLGQLLVGYPEEYVTHRL